MANKKVTITYNGSQILPQTELSNSNIIYNGNTLVSDGEYTKTLNCANHVMASNITVGTKTLNCNGQLMIGNVIVASVNAGPSTVLNDNTWSVIKQYSSTASSYWAIGDVKTGSYINAENHSYRILEFKHSGDSGNITFEQTDPMNQKYVMKATGTESTTTHCWSNSDLLASLNGFALDTDLSNNITASYKIAFTSASRYATELVQSRLWLLSSMEYAGTAQTITQEGSIYAYYNLGNSRVKTYAGSATTYWTRTVQGTGRGGSLWIYVKKDGTMSNPSGGSSGSSYGYDQDPAVPAFCI